MEARTLKEEKRPFSITLKALIVGGLILLLLIPGIMIQNLISERKHRSEETVAKINAKWSNAQTLCGPILSVPYSSTKKDSEGRMVEQTYIINIAPEDLKIQTILSPEERYYGIFKTIVYKSSSVLTGHFNLSPDKLPSHIKWSHANLHIGISDLRGVTKINIELDNHQLDAETESSQTVLPMQQLKTKTQWKENGPDKKEIPFTIQLDLNGSESINYIPVGRNTEVEIHGNWDSPGFTGQFSPAYTMEETGFKATWNILHFNRNIPDSWYNIGSITLEESVFGVNMVNTVDHYQQNMRSAKYAVMFIALTFVVFFFVEILSGKQIHPIQYLLVGFALILFYSLLLSFSEHLTFGLSYLIASAAIISMISFYAWSIFKNLRQTLFLTTSLITLYGFLYVILQLEDVALLIGSIGLFIILALIMYFSRKIDWYKDQQDPSEEYSAGPSERTASEMKESNEEALAERWGMSQKDLKKDETYIE